MTRRRPLPQAPPGLWDRPDMAEALDNRDVGAIFKIFQRWTGATQCQIARACEIPQSHVSEILNGMRRVMKLDLFEQFADGLDIPRGRLGLAERPPAVDAAPPRDSAVFEDRPVWAQRIRAERDARGWSQRDAVRLLQKHAGKLLPEEEHLLRRWKSWEAGDNEPSEFYKALIAAVFETDTDVFFPKPGTGGVLFAGGVPAGELLTVTSDGRTLALPGGPYQVVASAGDVMLVAIDRRKLMEVAGLLPVTISEQTRHDLLGSIVADRAAADVDEWREILQEYGLRFRSTPPAELLTGLEVDLAALGDALRHQRADPARRELQRVSALLAAIAAHTVANFGDLRLARRWWRTAKQAADESGHVETRLWVRGREIVGALSERLPTPVILDLVAHAEAISASAETPPTALPQMLGGKTQALALAGQAAPAEAALGEFRDNFDRLPAHIIRDTDSLFGFSEHDVRFTESYVYSHLGDFARAEQAQTAALALSPTTGQRRPAMIKLQQALCLVRTGDVASGVEHAHTAMTSLPRQHHARPVLSHGHRVLDAVPAGERDRDGVRAFRAYLDGHEAA